MPSYEVVLHERAWDTLSAADKPSRRALLLVIDTLKAAPFREGDFCEMDSTGRRNEVLLVEDWLITFWADHTVREIRILAIERVSE